MRSLKEALGKQSNELSTSKFSESKHALHNSESMWSIGEGSEGDEIKQYNKMVTEITELLKISPIVDQPLLNIIISNYEKLHGKALKQKQSVEGLKVIVKSMMPKCSDLQTQLMSLMDLIDMKIKKLRKKDEKYKMEFDEIAQKMFKKPQDGKEKKKFKENKKKILEINLQSEFQTKTKKKNSHNHDSGNSNANSNGTKNSGSGSQDSRDKKLNKLLASGSIQRLENPKEDDYCSVEGYNFSAVMSGSLAVKQRTQKTEQKQIFKNNNKLKNAQNSQGDQAFIFYRPKGRK